MNQQKHTSDLHIGRGWLNRAAEMLDSCEDHVSDAEFARAAAAIGAGFIALAHAERAAGTSATLEAAAERVRRAADEARPHDDELTASGVGSLSEAVALALGDAYAGIEFEDPTFERGTEAVMDVLRERAEARRG